MPNPDWVKGGESPNPNGRKRGKSQKVMLREAQDKALSTLISAAHRGDVVACAALLEIRQ